MSDPAIAYQSAVEQRFRASSALKAAMGLDKVRLYTLAAPNSAPHPYLVIGDDQIVGDETECSAGSEVNSGVRIYGLVEDDVSASRYQVKEIAAVVRTLIDRTLAVTGFDVVECEYRQTRHTTDRDERTAVAVVEHRLLLDPA